MIGAIAGDILGSYYEFEGIKEYNLPLLPPESRFTDDSVMTIAVARWLTEFHDKGLTKDQLIKIMQELGREYWDAGYGSSFNFWLWCENPQPYNSWGNGAAMRVSPVGLYANSLDEALELAQRTAEVSHNHPAGIAGAQAAAASVWLAKNGYSKSDIKDYIMCRFNYDLTSTIAEIRPNYRWDVSCPGSVPESIIAFLEGKDFEDIIRLVLSLGGDTDTMCCIAGAIAACVYNIPKWIVNECNNILSPKLLEYLTDFEVFIMKKSVTQIRYEF